MLGGKNKQSLGYTIVEIMIVLAISGVMFVIAASFVNGKQQQAAFTSGVNQMTSQIQDVIEQVTDGKYSDAPIICTPSGNTINIVGAAGVNTQGTNSGCVFLGKFMQFGVNGDNSKYNTYTLAEPQNATDLTGVVAVAPSPMVSGTDLTFNGAVPQGIDVKDIVVNSTLTGGRAVGTLAYGFGVIQSQGSVVQSGSGGNSYASGGQLISLVY